MTVVNSSIPWRQNEHRQACPRMVSIIIGLALAVAGAFPYRIEAATIKFPAVADNWVNSCVSGYDVNQGYHPEIRVRAAALWEDIKNSRMLLRFDLCDLSDLPVDPGEVTQWTLGLSYYAYHWENPEGRIYAVHRVTSSWDEMGSTWEVRIGHGTGDLVYWDSHSAGIPLYRPGGGDFVPAEYATAEVPAPGNWMTWDVTELVGEWIAEEHPNEGLLVKDACEFAEYPDYDIAWGPAHFRSVDYSNEDYRPYLEATFDLPCDHDDDGDVDLDDYALFADCMAGPDATPIPTSTSVDKCLDTFDFDGDDDVDVDDFAEFQTAFTEDI